MAEINLLKTPGTSQNNWQNASTWVVRVLVLFTLAVIVYYGFLFFKVKSTAATFAQTQESIAEAKKQALNMPGRQEFLIRQSQLKEFVSLSESHVNYSKLLPALAKVTLKTAYYTNINVNNQGKLVIQVVVPTLAELDKFLQVFDQPDVSKDFFNVRLAGFTKTENETGIIYTFSVQMDFNPAILAK